MAPSEKEQLSVCFIRSGEFSPGLLNSYTDAFKRAFGKAFSPDYFRHKYEAPVSGSSYHSLLTAGNNPGRIAGSCTVIPFEYHVFENTEVIGLVVDVFILPEYRYDPFSLPLMYDSLKKKVMEDGISFLLAVPNEMAFPFWKNIARFTEITQLRYHMFPVRIGNILRKAGWLNLISRLFLQAFIPVAGSLSGLFSPASKDLPIRLFRSEKFNAYRFHDGYTSFRNKKGCFFYKICDEDGIKTAYLVDCSPPSVSMVLSGVGHIMNHEQADAILYIGPLKGFLFDLFRVPKRLEPKTLPFMGRFLQKSSPDPRMFDKANWDLGLINYDVR